MKKLFKFSSVASLLLGVLFLTTGIGFVLSLMFLSDSKAWYSFLQSNWLIVILKLHTGLINIQDNPLHGLNLLDIIILALFSFLCFGLYTALKRFSKIWPLIAFILSFITIILFIATQNAGRSTVMLSVLIFSFVMLKCRIFNRLTIYTGILAAIFLFVGDLTVGIQSSIISLLFALGYVLLTLWFFLIARSLLYLGRLSDENLK
jgi:FlaA1/EpsC-like NDP-sugar epimerase